MIATLHFWVVLANMLLLTLKLTIILFQCVLDWLLLEPLLAYSDHVHLLRLQVGVEQIPNQLVLVLLLVNFYELFEHLLLVNSNSPCLTMNTFSHFWPSLNTTWLRM